MSDDLFPRAMSLAVHELRTPVTVVAGYIRMLLKDHGGPLNEKQRTMLEEAERSCGRISELVGEMSEMGKLESGQLALAQQEFDFAELVTDVASRMHEGRDRGVRLDVRSADAPVSVKGDRVRVAAAIKAVLHAALRERGEPSTVVATVKTVTDGNRRWAVLAVGDETAIETLLAGAGGTSESFDEWRGGMGMALPVARRVVEALGGALWAAPGAQARAGAALRLPS